MMTFYNTTGETGTTLIASRAAAKSDEELILAFMREHPYNTYAACDVWQALIALGRITVRKPLTSIRRGMNTLMADRKVVKLEATKIGYYGKKVHTWAVIGKAEQTNFNF